MNEPTNSSPFSNGARERVDVASASLGFDTDPPARVNLRFLKAQNRWSAYLLFKPGEAQEIKQWIQGYGPDNVVTTPGIFPRVIRAEWHQTPADWEWLEDDHEISMVSLLPEGIATIIMFGDTEAIDRFTQRTSPIPSDPRKIPVTFRPQRRKIEDIHLTNRQDEVLLLASSLGYYDVPHRINLRQLADVLGRSTGTVSEILRRGESRIITHHVTHTLMDEWKPTEKQTQSVGP